MIFLVCEQKFILIVMNRFIIHDRIFKKAKIYFKNSLISLLKNLDKYQYAYNLKIMNINIYF